MGTIADKLELLLQTKNAIREAIIGKGQAVTATAPFSSYPGKIAAIQTGVDASDATAGAGDILSPKTAYTASGKVEGIIPTLAAQTILPGTADQTIAGRQYLGGTQVIRGDPNLVAANIKKGVSIFGVAGTLKAVGSYNTCTVKNMSNSTITYVFFQDLYMDFGPNSNSYVNRDLVSANEAITFKVPIGGSFILQTNGTLRMNGISSPFQSFTYTSNGYIYLVTLPAAGDYTITSEK